MLTIAEHLVVCELPVFGKKNPKFEIHRALTKDTPVIFITQTHLVISYSVCH